MRQTLKRVYSPYVFATPLANGVKSFGMWVPNTDPSGSGLIANPLDYGEGGPLNKRRVELSVILDSTNPDLSTFQKRGGKLIVVIGTNDTLARRKLRWRITSRARQDGPRVGGFVRPFLCVTANRSRTRGKKLQRRWRRKELAVQQIPSTYNRLGLIMDWVERGRAPGKSVPVTSGERSLSTCSCPEYPKYSNGRAASESSYVCAAK